MIKGFCKQGNIERALVLLEDMNKVKIKPDEVLFNSLLDGCCRVNLIDVGLMVYRNMIREKIKPSNVTFSILIKIHGKSGDLMKALGVFEEMKKMGVQAGLIVYTCLI
jgi:pentatricopeptide repeat domain-containing protein 1